MKKLLEIRLPDRHKRSAKDWRCGLTSGFRDEARHGPATRTPDLCRNRRIGRSTHERIAILASFYALTVLRIGTADFREGVRNLRRGMNGFFNEILREIPREGYKQC